jgi:hypothetical protein
MKFHQWLKCQEGRQDCIGELARELLRDPLAPFWSNRLATYRTFLIYRDATKRLAAALESAFLEWRRGCC